MQSLDGLERFFCILMCSKLLRNNDEFKRPHSYDDADFVTKVPKWLKTCNENIFVSVIMVQFI